MRTDPASAAQAFKDAVGRMEEVQLPDDVAEEWDRLVAVWGELRDLIAGMDPGDPDAVAGLADDALDVESELVDAGTAVDDWGQANC